MCSCVAGACGHSDPTAVITVGQAARYYGSTARYYGPHQGGSLSTTDPGAEAGCNCGSWCEEGPRAGAEALGTYPCVIASVSMNTWQAIHRRG